MLHLRARETLAPLQTAHFVWPGPAELPAGLKEKMLLTQDAKLARLRASWERTAR